MGLNERRARAAETAKSVRSNPYVKRLMEDEELRDNIRVAFDAARDAYGRMANGKGPAKALFEDKKVQRDLRTAAESLREASEQLRGKRKRKGISFGRLLLVAALGAVLVLVLSEDARNAVLDKLFGAEEEFEYNSTTIPQPDPVTTSS